ncbi:MAG: helix-turn-helix transcriptional regulator [Phycisphaerales bacterium]|nr:helix-turn-helix transcriptional regulator [Phycisphaerales bacterium]MCB9864644.1 helix-turn-helix transcriptional regulator [Phycisphaerales bacterium]
MTDDAHPVHHRCAFGHTCVFTPLSVDGQCVAYCKFALESDAAVDRYVELLDVLAENACSHLTEHDNHCVIHPAPEHVKKDQSIDFSGDGWSEVVHRAVELIDEQFADPDLTVACVARRLCLNRDYLSHLFRVQTGQRMSRHIFLRRMQQARKLLMTTDFQVRQIALDSGFLNTDWFSHTFHELEGITPSQFRRNARRQNDTPAPRH